MADYGVGNLGSVMRSLEELGADPVLISKAADLEWADRIILPGVGAFADCMEALEAGGWPEAISQMVQVEGRLILGICAGMQLLSSGSTEGASDKKIVPGLGYIPGLVRNIGQLGVTNRIPHIGWNAVLAGSASGTFFEGIPDGTDFYFVHSYSFVPDDPAHVAATVHYGVSLTAAVRKDHVWGTQFHPEKSSRAGLRVLKNFIDAKV
ncbi:imidazole glycerol phosphate synthase subunit HisH [Altererythrobacter litoralis]|uniref:Imidazole glycerol phosphate synthase subunit HisH n=1 Tax=Altererythrobacter litoralis TaxID=3113904 RepID=A0ABU7GF00_9SPHN|nr:imidazole glycerol phosphate synthase subunit HisH [Erythrobacteraceae bacterium 1XM1-14]